MAIFDMPRPRFTAEDMDDEKQRKKIVSWLVQLDEKLRYMLQNIDEENLSVQMGEQIRLIAQGVEDSKAVIEVLPDQVRIAVTTLQEEIDGMEFDEFETAGSEIVLKATEARISTPLFVVDITNTETGTALRIDRDGAVMDYLTVNEELHAPNVVERYTGPTTITLAQGDSLQAALNTINGKLLSEDVTIDVTGTGGRIVEDITIRDVFGSGSISITGGSETTENGTTVYARTTINGWVNISGCAVRVYMRYLVIQPINQDTNTVRIDRSDYVWIEGSVMDGSMAGILYFVVWAAENAKVILVNDILWGSENAILINIVNGAELISNNIRGTGAVFLRAGFAKAIMSGTRPEGQYNEVVSGTVMALPADPSTLTAERSDYTPSTPYGTEEVWIEAVNSGSWHMGMATWGAGLNQGIDAVRSGGAWQVNDYRGAIWFDADELYTMGNAIMSASLGLWILDGPTYGVDVYAWAVALEYHEETGADIPTDGDPANNIIKLNNIPVGGLIGKCNPTGKTELSGSKMLEIVNALTYYARLPGEQKKIYGILLYTGETSYSQATRKSVNRAEFYPAGIEDRAPTLTVTRLTTV